MRSFSASSGDSTTAWPTVLCTMCSSTRGASHQPASAHSDAGERGLEQHHAQRLEMLEERHLAALARIRCRRDPAGDRRRIAAARGPAAGLRRAAVAPRSRRARSPRSSGLARRRPLPELEIARQHRGLAAAGQRDHQPAIGIEPPRDAVERAGRRAHRDRCAPRSPRVRASARAPPRGRPRRVRPTAARAG